MRQDKKFYLSEEIKKSSLRPKKVFFENKNKSFFKNTIQSKTPQTQFPSAIVKISYHVTLPNPYFC